MSLKRCGLDCPMPISPRCRLILTPKMIGNLEALTAQSLVYPKERMNVVLVYDLLRLLLFGSKIANLVVQRKNQERFGPATC